MKSDKTWLGVNCEWNQIIPDNRTERWGFNATPIWRNGSQEQASSDTETLQVCDITTLWAWHWHCAEGRAISQPFFSLGSQRRDMSPRLNPIKAHRCTGICIKDSQVVPSIRKHQCFNGYCFCVVLIKKHLFSCILVQADFFCQRLIRRKFSTYHAG